MIKLSYLFVLRSCGTGPGVTAAGKAVVHG